MLDRIQEFKAALSTQDPDQICDFFESLPELEEELDIAVVEEFADPDAVGKYKNTAIWHTLVSSSVADERVLTTDPVIIEWLSERLDNHLSRFEIAV